MIHLLRHLSPRGAASRISRLPRLAVLLALCTGAALAQPRAGDESLLFEAIPSVFAASRFEQPVSEAPATVTVITATEIRRQGFRTLADIIGSARGFFSTNDRNYSYLGVRGFARTGDFNSRLLLLIDGHRTNDNVYGTASLGQEALIDVSLIERVEIVRGPGSSLYGANALFGTINIITRRGRDFEGNALEVGIGNQQTLAGQATTGRRLENGLEYLVSASTLATRGEDRIRFPAFDAPATNGGIAEKLDAERARRMFAKAQYEDFGVTAAMSERRKSIPTGSFSTIFNDPANRTNDDQFFLELRHRADLGGGDLRSRLSYDRYYYYGDYAYGPPTVRLNKDSASGAWWGAEVSWSGVVAPDHRVTMGGEFRHNIEIRQRNYDVALNLDDSRRDHVWGVFLQDEWRIARAWLLNLGLRHDRHGSASGRTSPRIALNFRAREQTNFKILHGEAFRPPNAYEAFYNDGNATQKANPRLASETIRTDEFAWEEQFNQRWRGSLGLYRYRINGLITQRLDPVDGLLVFVNQSAVNASGVELEVNGRFASGADLHMSLANQANRDQSTGASLANSPQNLFKSRLVMPLASEHWFAGMELNYLGARRTLAGARNSPYWVTNLTLTGDRLLPGVRMSLNIQNLFDRAYTDPGGPEHLPDRIPQTGRTMLARFEFRF